MKNIVIDGKECQIDCNALTYVKYKSIFKTGIIKDMQSVQNYLIKQTVASQKINESDLKDMEKIAMMCEYMNSDVDEFITIITRIAWILIYTANEKVENYENWLKNISKFKIDDDWIVEVAEFAVNCFC